MQSQHSSTQPADIQTQLRNFIQLLQNNDPTAYKSLKSSGQLSVILSASEPQSSSVDKENSSHSANKSIKNSEFQTTESSLIFTTIKELHATGLNKLQEKLLGQLAFCIDDILKKNAVQQQRLLLLQDQLAKEKKGTDQLLEALVKMDEEQKDLWNTYQQLSDKCKLKSNEADSLVQQNNTLKGQIETHKKQLKFVKNLVYIANSNFQELQNNYNQLLHKNQLPIRHAFKPLLVLREKRSEKNLLTQRSDFSQGSKKIVYSPRQENHKNRPVSPDQYEVSSSCSPLGKKSSKSIRSRRSISPLQKDKQNIECNFKDVYRQMLIKNLKGKRNMDQ